MKELFDFSSLNEAFGLPACEPVSVDWSNCEALIHPCKRPPVLEETKELLSAAAKRRYATPEGQAHLKKNGKTAMAKVSKQPGFEEKRLAGLRAKCELTWTVQKGDIVDRVTLKEFIAKYGGNLGSLKQMVWRKGAYKGWIFTS